MLECALRMGASISSTSNGRHELERHLEDQMRAQERQLVWVRLGMVLVAALFLLIVDPDLESRPVLFVLAAVIAISTLAIPWLLARFPAREVGIVSTALDMAASPWPSMSRAIGSTPTCSMAS
ncbi:hypothetical protein BH24CHL10_BH24CHL10_11420 [soil metagenome]